MTDLNDKLLPCPFCGGAGEENYHKSTESYYIACSQCTAHTCQHGAEKEEAIAAWNRRATPAPQAAPSDTSNSAKQALHIMSQAYNLGWREGDDEGAWEFVTRMSYETGWNDAVERHAAAPASLTPAPQGTASELTDAVAAMGRAKKLPVWDAIDHRLHVELDTIFKALSAASLTQAATSEPVGYAEPAMLAVLKKYPTADVHSIRLLDNANERMGFTVPIYAGAAPAAAHPAPSDVVGNLRGVAKMVANMLLRDKTPVREEAAYDLLQAVAALSAQQAGVQEAPRDDFDSFWHQAVVDNGGVGIGADFRHWAEKGYHAGIRAALSASSAVTNEDAKAKDGERVMRWIEKFTEDLRAKGWEDDKIRQVIAIMVDVRIDAALASQGVDRKGVGE